MPDCIAALLCLFVECLRAKEIKHSGPHISKKVVKKQSVINNSVKSSSPVPPSRPRGRPPKNGYPQSKPSDDIIHPAKRKSNFSSSDSPLLSSALPSDNLQLR